MSKVDFACLDLANDAYVIYITILHDSASFVTEFLVTEVVVRPKSDLANDDRPVVVVVGMHRSGTSLCSHILSALGVDMATSISAHANNPKGHWERWDIVGIHDRILHHFDRDYLGSKHDFPLPPAWWADPFVREMENEICQIVSGEMEKTDFFGFKDPRTAKFLPMWNRIFKRLKLKPYFVFCLRNFADVARSLHARDNLPRVVGELRALLYVSDILRYLGESRICVVRYETWFSDIESNVNRLLDFLPLRPFLPHGEVISVVKKIIDPSLNHGFDDARYFVSPIAETCYHKIVGTLEYDHSNEELLSLLQKIEWIHNQIYEIFEILLKPGADAEANLIQVRMELDSANASLLELRGASEVNLAEISSLNLIRNELTEKVAESAAMISNLSEQLNHKNSEFEGMKAEHTGVVQQLQAERDGLLASVEELQRQINEVSELSGTRLAELEARNAETETEKSKLSQLEIQVQGQSSELASLNLIRSELEKELSDIRAHVETQAMELKQSADALEVFRMEGESRANTNRVRRIFRFGR